MKCELSVYRLHIACVVGLIFFIAAPAAHADANGLLEVEQVVFGMDCAPCAYGVEQSLRKLPGAQRVRVSLNEGKASISFKPDNDVTLLEIRKRILDNGFTPKSARIRAVGYVVFHGDDIRLTLGPKSVLVLQPRSQTDESWSVLRDAKSGATMEVTGVVNDKPGDPPGVTVDSVKLVEPAGSGR